jgi:hemerythrin-like domain-containing protein
MKATEILMNEHRVIERVLSAMEAAVHRLQAGDEVDAAFFIDATEFIRGFADGCHHHKEEGVLFKAMNAAGMPRDQGPVAVMLAEHEQARALTRGLREAAEKLQAGDEDAKALIIRNAQSYAALLREHIAKEDQVLFPMAEGVIPKSQHERVLADFDKVEHEETGAGVHEKYLALADKLEKQVEG